MISKSEYYRSKFQNKKENYKQNFKIVKGQIKAILQNKIKVYLPNNEVGDCYISNISDFHIKNLESKFVVGQLIDIAIIGKNDEDEYVLNYKMIHPKEIKYKIKAIPTASHYRTLSKYLNIWIKKNDDNEDETMNLII